MSTHQSDPGSFISVLSVVEAQNAEALDPYAQFKIDSEKHWELERESIMRKLVDESITNLFLVKVQRKTFIRDEMMENQQRRWTALKMAMQQREEEQKASEISISRPTAAFGAKDRP